jgi:hypothetical protein
MLLFRSCDWSDTEYWSKESILYAPLLCLPDTTDLLTDCREIYSNME